MKAEDINKCQKCGSAHIVKWGTAYSVRKGIKIQKFRCSECGRIFRGMIQYYLDSVNFKYCDRSIPKTDWTAYTKAQNSEKQMLTEIILELLSNFEVNKDSTKKGRKFSDIREMCFCLALKTYTKLSSRRLHSDLETAKKQGLIDKTPHFTTLMNYLEKPELTDLLQELIKLSALPVKEIETQYAIDSSGFSSSQFGRWFDYKWGKEKKYRNWVKAHVMCGTKTNMITSVELTKAHGADSPRLQPLVEKTCKDFDVKEISADKAYLSRKNLKLIYENGAIPFIPFKKTSKENSRGSMIWKKCFLYFKNYPQEYLEHYHKRSNVETCFAMVKQKFGKDVMSKNFQSQTNEVLLKILCHNVCCLIHEYHENNIEALYSTNQPKIKIPLL